MKNNHPAKNSIPQTGILRERELRSLLPEALLVGLVGVIAIPLAFAITAALETLAPTAVLLLKLRVRLARIAIEPERATVAP
jgi:hypothetical protein